MYLHEYNNTMYNQLIDYKIYYSNTNNTKYFWISSANPIFFSLIENREMLLWD
jgi:hypothetical protein